MGTKLKKQLRNTNLEQRSVNVLCKESDNTMLWLCGHRVSVATTKQPEAIHKCIDVPLFQ